jgi:hypothetical protein
LLSGPVTILLATLLACLVLLVSDLITLAMLWTALVLVGAGQQMARAAGAAEHPRTAVAGIAPWLGLALVGAPVLWIASALATDGGTATGLTAALGSTRLSVRALLVVVGAASAGLAPLGGWLRVVENDERSAFIADGLLPLVGLALAARALGPGGAAPPASLAGLLVLLGLCGCAEAAWSAWRADEADGLLRVIGRADAGLAFLALAAGSSFGVAAATFVVGAGVLARAIARTSPGRWPAWLAWASLAGFPGFAGFVGRWLLLAAIFASGQPLLALSAALASVSLGVAAFRATLLVLGGLVKKEPEPRRVGFGGIVAVLLLVVAGLAPSQLLLAAIAAAIAGPLGAPGWSGLLVPPATLVALLPLIVATPFLNRKRARRSDAWRKAERRLWGAAQHLAERTARLAGVVDTRYDLAVGLLVAVATLFAVGS